MRWLAGDLREPPEVERLAAEVEGDAVDMVVNNAGGIKGGALLGR